MNMNSSCLQNRIDSDTSTQARVKISKQLILLCEKNSDPWGIKDTDSRYLYGNSAYIKLLNLPFRFKIDGLLDTELPHPIAEHGHLFKENDLKVQESQKNFLELDIYPYGSKKIMQPYIFEKIPFYNDDGHCAGTIFHAKKWSCFSPLQCIDKAISHSLIFYPPVDIFTERELQIVFYLLQSFNCKEIAKKLYLSHRTIENKLQQMYRKADVNSLSALRDFCRKKGFSNYIPPKFLIPSTRLLNSNVS